MKKLFTILTTLLITITAWAQSPEKMSYQAVVRDAANALAISQGIGIQISILQSTSDGTAVYIERHFPTTNSNALVTLEIGDGMVVSGTFADIDWANGPYFIKTEIDLNGGATYTISGTSQILSVPYALFAKTAESVAGGINETDPLFSDWDKSTGITISESQITDLTHTIDTQLDSTDIVELGFVAGPHTADSDTQLDSTDIANLGYVADAATKADIDALEAQIEVLQNSLIASVGLLKDYDGNLYPVVTIGTQVWMAENLRTTRYNNGIEIPNVTEIGDWGENIEGAYVWYNNDSSTYAQTYGALYNWYAVDMGQLCPIGWHPPTDEEWTTLTDYLGGLSVAGGKLKETDTTHWSNPNTGAINEVGFTALPAGYRHSDGNFNVIDYAGYWWTNTPNGSSAYCRILLYNSSSVINGSNHNDYAFSVRCVKD